MQINGSLPFHVARAYGVRPGANAASVQGPGAPQTIAATSPTRDLQATEGPQRLVAARVAGPVDFESSGQLRSTASAVLPLYTRAADRIEAAVGVSLGRQIDVSG